MPRLSSAFSAFFEGIRDGEISVYSEISLQFELGIHLRRSLPQTYRVEFERPVSHFGFNPEEFHKKEIDLLVYSRQENDYSAIELKFPQNGQYPEQMYKSIMDIAFLEQLGAVGFNTSYFLILAEDPLFYSGPGEKGIYRYFRSGERISGRIPKPTGRTNASFEIDRSYEIRWSPLRSRLKYALVIISSIEPRLPGSLKIDPA